MRRVRAAFGLIGGGLLVLVALVVWRAEQSLEVERVARHDTLAERLFDEIERELSSFLAEEETRPLVDYAGPRSRPLHPFVIGLFQLHPDGSFEAHPAGGASVADDATERLARLQRLTRTLTDREDPREGLSSLAEQKAASAQRAGSTQNLKLSQPSAQGSKLERKREDYSAYDALQSLNRGVQRRSLRKDRSAGAEGRAGAGLYALEAEQEADEPLGDARPGRVAPGDARRQGDAKPEVELRSALEARAPMQARALDPRHLVLFRTVLRDGRATHQGLWVDTAGFYAWLEESALGASSVAGYATLRFFGPFDAEAALPAGEFVYRHRFGEPFDAVQAILALEALPGLGGAAYTRALSALLVVAALLGLFALYRMIDVAMRFAERRSNFVASVSHELKTPLTAIRMYAEMLRDGVVDGEAKRREYYASITNESERLSRLIDNVLEFSKLEKGHRELALVAGPVEPVVHEVERLLAAHVKSAGFSLAVEIDPGLPPVRYDRDALIQVLFNLVDNALKYAREAETKRITLRCARADGGVSISVRDFGPGLAAGELGKVFEPFYRSGPEPTRRARGSGIGLALVRSLGEAMGATVRAENAEPAGLRVSLVLTPG